MLGMTTMSRPSGRRIRWHSCRVATSSALFGRCSKKFDVNTTSTEPLGICGIELLDAITALPLRTARSSVGVQVDRDLVGALDGVDELAGAGTEVDHGVGELHVLLEELLTEDLPHALLERELLGREPLLVEPSELLAAEAGGFGHPTRVPGALPRTGLPPRPQPGSGGARRYAAGDGSRSGGCRRGRVGRPGRPRRRQRPQHRAAPTELPNHRLADRAYLRWLYDENPIGHAIRRRRRRGGFAHRALRDDPAALPGPRRHGSRRLLAPRRRPHRHPAAGLFRQLGQEITTSAQAAGWQFASGVCNEKSIGTVVKYLDWKTPGPLPVRVASRWTWAVAPRATRSTTRSAPAPSISAAGLDSFPVSRVDELVHARVPAWRLACPSASYAVHVTDELVGISTTDKRFGVRAAVILKLLPRDGRGGLRAGPIVGAACRFHRAPYAVYAGFNAHVRVRGFQPPRRLQPSPLHLILRSFSPASTRTRFASTRSSSSTWTRTDR